MNYLKKCMQFSTKRLYLHPYFEETHYFLNRTTRIGLGGGIGRRAGFKIQ